jgi:N4-gp56 family major capsid protein
MANAYAGIARYTGALTAGYGSPIFPDYWADFVRENVWPRMYFRQLGYEVVIPAHTGDRVRIPKFTPSIAYSGGIFTAGTATAVSYNASDILAVDAKNTMSAGELTAQIVSFEGAHGYSAKSVLTSHTDIVAEALEQLGHEAAWRADTYFRTKLSGSTVSNLKSAAGETAGATTNLGRFRAKELIRGATLLESAGAPTWSDGHFVAIAHSLVKYDLFLDTSASGFTSVTQYGDPSRAYRGEVGALWGCRLLTTSTMPRLFGKNSTTATTYLSQTVSGGHAFFYSPRAFYTVSIQQGGMKVKHVRPGDSGISDPTAKLGTVGIQFYTGIAVTPKAEYRHLIIAHSTSLAP